MSDAITDHEQQDTAATDTNNKPSPPEKATYSPEQQAHIDTVILPARLKRERKNLTAELTDSITAKATAELTEKLTAELTEKLKSQANQQKATDPELAAINREIELERAKRKSILPDLQNKMRETHAVEQELAGIKKEQAVIAAMGDQFHNANLIFALVQDRIELDAGTGKYVVRGEDGKIMNDASLEPISLETFFTSFASVEANRYLVKGLPKGTEPNPQTTKTQTRQILAKADIKSDAERIRFINEHGYERFASLPLRRQK